MAPLHHGTNSPVRHLNFSPVDLRDVNTCYHQEHPGQLLQGKMLGKKEKREDRGEYRDQVRKNIGFADSQDLDRFGIKDKGER